MKCYSLTTLPMQQCLGRIGRSITSSTTSSRLIGIKRSIHQCGHLASTSSPSSSSAAAIFLSLHPSPPCHQRQQQRQHKTTSTILNRGRIRQGEGVGVIGTESTGGLHRIAEEGRERGGGLTGSSCTRGMHCLATGERGEGRRWRNQENRHRKKDVFRIGSGSGSRRYMNYESQPNKYGNIMRAEKVIIVRHGESMGNVDEGTYVVVPDWKVPLTKKGHQDAHSAGEKIKELVGEKPLYIYCSPYMRTKQTLARIVEALEGNTIVGVREEPRLTEQAFGNFQNVEGVRFSKAERNKFGRFYYRFPDGESGLDVYSRVTSFLSTLYGDFADDAIKDPDLNVIIVTHGLTLRLLVMRWFQYSISDFEESANPPNGGLVVAERKTDEKGNQWYELTQESCDLIGLKSRHTKGSLWRVLQDIEEQHYDENGWTDK